MPTSNRKKANASSMDYSPFINQPLIVVSCDKHSQKKEMFVTKFTSKLNPNPLQPMVIFGFTSFKKNEIVSMYLNTKGYPTLTQTIDITTYQRLNKFSIKYDEQLKSLNSLQ